MGEMADWINEEGADADDAWYTPNHECAYCGRRNLHWARLENGKWRLATEAGKLHTCNKHPSLRKNKHFHEEELRHDDR